jgi:hypothetical protein
VPFAIFALDEILDLVAVARLKHLGLGSIRLNFVNGVDVSAVVSRFVVDPFENAVTHTVSPLSRLFYTHSTRGKRRPVATTRLPCWNCRDESTPGRVSHCYNDLDRFWPEPAPSPVSVARALVFDKIGDHQKTRKTLFFTFANCRTTNFFCTGNAAQLEHAAHSRRRGLGKLPQNHPHPSLRR